MKIRRLPIALSIAAALALPHASTAALGGVRSLSGLGEPFHAEILIEAARLDGIADCLRIVPDDSTPAWLEQARIEVVGEGAMARIVISSARPAHEPVLSLTIEHLCAPVARSSYTLVLPGLEAPELDLPARRKGSATPPGPYLRLHQDVAVSRRPGSADPRAAPGAQGATHGNGLPPALSERREEVIAALQRTIAAEAALLERIRELEGLQAALEQQVRAQGIMMAERVPATRRPAQDHGLETVSAPAPRIEPEAGLAVAVSTLPAVDPKRYRLHVVGNLVLGALLTRLSWRQMGRLEER